MNKINELMYSLAKTVFQNYIVYFRKKVATYLLAKTVRRIERICSVLVYALHSLENVQGLARFRMFVPKLYYIESTFL